jgi:hypothetical protein
MNKHLFSMKVIIILNEDCVNTVQYSPDMSIFVSGSEDT